MANPLVIDCTGLALGSGAVGVRAVIDTDVAWSRMDETTGLEAVACTINVQGVEFSASSGTINPLQGDRSAWDALAFASRHTNDADASIASIHHSLGTGAGQAAPGNHAHSIPSAANPSTQVDGSVHNGSAATYMRSDAAPKLADTAVTPATYGDATHTPQVTIDQQGRVTAASNVTITAGHTIEDEGAPLTSRTNLNFTGTGVNAVDDSANNASKVTINYWSPLTNPEGPDLVFDSNGDVIMVEVTL